MDTQANIAAIKDNITGENNTGENVNLPLKLLTASSIIGDSVYNNEDEDMGSIIDIMLDIRTGTIEYYIIEFGGFLGIGEKFFAIPFELLHIDPEQKIFRFNEKKETLKQAPGFDKAHWPGTNAHMNYVNDSWSFWGV